MKDKKKLKLKVNKEFKKVNILLGLFFLFLFISFVSSDEPEVEQSILWKRTASTETYKNPDGTYTKTLYSGIRNVYEDDKWKRVEEDRSLRGSGIECIIGLSEKIWPENSTKNFIIFMVGLAGLPIILDYDGVGLTTLFYGRKKSYLNKGGD